MVNYIDSDYLKLRLLPENINISTISATCCLGTSINLGNVYKYVKLDLATIFTVKYKNKVRSLEPQKKKKKKKNCFQNQMTVEIKPDLEGYPDSKVSVKIFKNGSIQMSGIKSIVAVNTVLNKLVNELKKEFAKIEEGKMTAITFVDKTDDLKITKFKVDMINSGFEIGYEVNRENLYNALLDKKIECKFEPSIHAGVNIKFVPSDNKQGKKVSIFVFESGNIIITGAKTVNNILESYNYIKNFMNDHKSSVQKSKICEMLRNNISDEINGMLQIDEDDDLLALALSEANVNL